MTECDLTHLTPRLLSASFVSVPSVPSLVFDALLRAARCDGPARLTESATRPTGKALFPVTGAAPAIAEAVPRWLQDEPRAANQPRHVRLTAAGAEELLARTPPMERCALVLSASPLYQRLLLHRWLSLLQTHGWTGDRPEWERCAERLAADFISPEPKTDAADADFWRCLAHELAISWKHAQSPEARDGIARAMLGAGLRPIGSAGEQVAFAGRLHVATEPMFPGDPAFIVEPGWMIHDGSGEYLLEKALVAPV